MYNTFQSDFCYNRISEAWSFIMNRNEFFVVLEVLVKDKIKGLIWRGLVAAP
jgi:hypothetical protein